MLNDIIGTLSFLQPGLDDDFTDRLNYYHTSTFLIVVAILVSFKMLAGRPLECWVPAEYTGSWEGYSEVKFGFLYMIEEQIYDLAQVLAADTGDVDPTPTAAKRMRGPPTLWGPQSVYCWAESTYYVPFDSSIPRELAERDYMKVSYYQWVPFFLLITALAYYFPCIVWRVFNSKSGVVLNDIVAIAKDRGNIHPETRRTNIEGMGEHLLSIFRHQWKVSTDHEGLHRVFRCLNIRYYESYMVCLYLFVKFLFLANSSSQLFLINRFLQTDRSRVYGWGVIEDLFAGKGWKDSGNFPRVTMCDLDIRVLGNVQKHTVQCVLVINIFTEKIFILLWIWFALLSIVNLGSFVYWFSASILLRERKRFVERQLSMASADFSADECPGELRSFVANWLKMDGVFVLRILTFHSGLMFSMQLIEYMWKQYLKQHKSVMQLLDGHDTKRSLAHLEGVDGGGDDNVFEEEEGEQWERSSLPPISEYQPPATDPVSGAPLHRRRRGRTGGLRCGRRACSSPSSSRTGTAATSPPRPPLTREPPSAATELAL